MLKAHQTPTSLWNVDNDLDLIGLDHHAEAMVTAFNEDLEDLVTSCRDGPVYAEV